MKRGLTLLFLVACFSLFDFNAFAGQGDNSRRLTTGWQFYKGDLGGPWEVWRKASHRVEYEEVTLPHCFNAFDSVDPDVAYYQGPGWYYTAVQVDNPYSQGRTLLHFEGAGQKTDVYVYMTKVGHHVGGYDEFVVDITEAVKNFKSNKELTQKYKGKVPVAIRCDNSRDLEMIPSDLSDFNVYGGLYRYLNLKYVPAVSVERAHIKSSVRADGTAQVDIKLRLYNPDNIGAKMPVEATVVDPQGKTVFRQKITQSAWKEPQQLFSFVIDTPQLWSPDQPALYTCTVELKDGSHSQRVAERFGVRSFEFVKKGPFKLNGERLLLRGTHRHEDHAGVAAAMTEDMMRQEMQLMKEMGVNFIRLAHYQQSRIILELCDELGILVWEEIPWCRGGLGGAAYQQQARDMLAAMIDQHYNHPAVIIWGMGNENDWPGDFPEFDKNAIRAFMSELNQLSHTLDPSRKTAIRRCNFCKDIIDVYSPSIWAGWYRGRYTEYKNVSRKEMEGVDHFLHVEWGASNHARRHSEDPDKGLSQIKTGGGADERSGDYLMTGGKARVSKDSEWTETYACNLIDWHLKEQETMPWLTGAAYWPFKDFSTPVRPTNPVPYVNQKGVVERDMTLKEGYYVFQSYWTEKPMVHIYGHTWPTRWGDEGDKRLVKVYSNCPTMELFLNGKSMGTRQRNSQDFPAAGLRWAVQFKPGLNRLKAVGKKDGVEVVDEHELTYQTQKWGKVAQLKLDVVDRKDDQVTVELTATDDKGVVCLGATDFVRFGLIGDGRMIDNLGTSTGSRKVQLQNGLARINIMLNGGVSYLSGEVDGAATVFEKLQ